MATWRGTGAELYQPYFLALLAETYGTEGRTDGSRAGTGDRGVHIDSQKRGALVGGGVSQQRALMTFNIADFEALAYHGHLHRESISVTFPLVNREHNGKKHAPFPPATPHRCPPIHCFLNRLIPASDPPANAVVFLPITFDSQLCLVSHLQLPSKRMIQLL